MVYYDLRIMYKNGLEKTFRYDYKDYKKALKRAHALNKSCKIVYVVDGRDYRTAFEKKF